MRTVREIRVKDLVIYFWLQLFILLATWGAFIALAVTDALPFTVLYLLPAVLVFDYMPTRCFIIGCVLMYKAYAPMSVRERCRFTPTCSTYMIMAINKYGVIVGVIKGLRRITRCKPPNGGEDLP